MSHSVAVLITGISLLVNPPLPSGRAAGAGTLPQPAYVLMANNPAMEESVFYPQPEAGAGMLPRHVAFVRYLAADRVDVASTRSADAVVTVKDLAGTPQTYGVIVLDREAIDLSVTANPPDLTADTSPCVILPGVTRATKLPLTCIQGLAQICKECGALLPAGHLPSTVVGARLNLTTGNLTSTQVDVSRIWYFDPQPAGFPPIGPVYMPQAIELDLSMPSSDLVLTFTDLATGSISTTLTLRASSTTAPLTVLTGSAPIEDVLNLGISSEMTDHHFELYYSMLAMGTLQHPPIPKRIGTADNPLGGTLPMLAGEANCPPTWWP